MDWVVTLPKSSEWSDYQKEIDTVKDGSVSMNFRVSGFPKELKSGDRCYLVWRGRVRGWMKVVGTVWAKTDWRCFTTGKRWPAGRYVQRSGPFHEVDGPEMKGFQGIRKFNP